MLRVPTKGKKNTHKAKMLPHHLSWVIVWEWAFTRRNLWGKCILSLFCKTPGKGRATVSHQAGPGANQGSQGKCERSWTISYEQSSSGTPALYFMSQSLAGALTVPIQVFYQLEVGREREGEREQTRAFSMVRHFLESSPQWRHLLCREAKHLGWHKGLLVGWGWPPVHGAEQFLCWRTWLCNMWSIEK